MAHYEAIFEVESRADADAVRRLLERTYDTLREETHEVYGDVSGQSEMLDEFEAIRDATRRSRPGRLVVRYDQHDEPFED